MRKLRRKKFLLLLTLCIISLIVIVKLFNLEFYNIVKLTYDRTCISQFGVERVKVSDVVAVKDFIKLTPPRQHEYYFYNNARSDQIGAFRALPDTRDAVCSARPYYIPSKKSKVSVIIAFHNEARSALIRTLMSVFRRSPAKYLYEVILVDDFSEDVTLLSMLQQLDFAPFTHNLFHLNTSEAQTLRSSLQQPPAPPLPLPRQASPTSRLVIKMHSNAHRLGVIESRNRGARLATGDYLLFLDSHCEVNVGWLEPLLERVAMAAARGHVSAASPVLDSIDAETLAYSPSSKNLMGGFDWNLHFHWLPRHSRRSRSRQDAVEPFKSPTFAGGIFMISRNWFFKLNAFNSLLEIWGGESIEFSIKLWLCGGQIEIVPCSRVGHIFRQQHPFEFPRGADGHATYLRNSKIIAESWLDAYKYLFYASKPAAKDIPVNISYSAIGKLKRDLHCRPFAWYLQNVFTELRLPNDDFTAFGTLSSAGRCVQIYNRDAVPSSTYTFAQPLLASCYHSDVTHWYLHRHSSRLHSSTGSCLNVVQLSNRTASAQRRYIVVLQYCRSTPQAQRWLRRGAQLIHAQTHFCLDNPVSDVVAVSQCRHVAPSQLFRFSMEVQKL